MEQRPVTWQASVPSVHIIACLGFAGLPLAAGKLLLESITFTAEPPEKWTASAHIIIVLGLM
jgi:hypothetical protein